MATLVELKCENCEKNFSVRKGKEKKTCSNECAKKIRQKRNEIYYVKKECGFCGNVFRSKRKDKKTCCSYECAAELKKKNNREERKCVECGKLFLIKKNSKTKLCSDECRKKWASRKENKTKRINKSKKVLKEKYGVDSIFKIEGVQKAIQEKNKNNPNVSIEKARRGIEEKRIKKLNKRFSELGYNILKFKENGNIVVRHPDGHIFENDRKLIVNRLNHDVELSTEILPISAPKSTLELKISNFLKENNILHETNNRNLLKNKEVDILIQEKNLCIEINGLHWHSEYYIKNNYHLDKLNECNVMGYDLLQFFEDEIIEKEKIVKSIIKSKLGLINNKIFARKCKIKEIDSKSSKQFLELNHIQGSINSSIKLGLFYNEELVSVMTFGKGRKALGSNSKGYEMYRFCNKINTTVVGGASKLFKYFINNYNFNEIVSYANRRYSNGDLYNSLGFTKINETSPNYYYVINKKRIYRFNFRKDVLVKEGYDKNKTEHEIMLERKIPRIYDCGNIKYIYKKADN